MRRLLSILSPLCLLWGADPAAAETHVDLELVLAVDVSGSMDRYEQEVQKKGYVEALMSEDVLSAIRIGPYQRIALAYVEWAGHGTATLTIPWTLIDGPAALERFTAQIAAAPYVRYRGTSISAAIDYSASLFPDNGFEGLRRVIDISGDGPNNSGRPVELARDTAVDQDIVINGLPLLIRPSGPGYGNIPDLDSYYENCVIGGPGSFMIAVTEIEQFPTAIRRKLVEEIAGRAPTAVPVAYRPVQGRSSDCMVGEMQRRMWEP